MFSRQLHHINALLAALTLIAIIFATTMLWPVSYSGFNSDPVTNIVTTVVPDSPADQAGLSVGDRIVVLYGVPIEAVWKSVNVLHALTAPARLDLIIVERDGHLVTTRVPNPPPTWSFQATKLAFGLLGLLCWATGYLLGVVRHQAMPRTPLVASFWLLMGGVTGTMLFTHYAAFPLFVGSVWLTIALLAPLAVYVHLWFPAPAFPDAQARLLGQLVLSGSLLSTTALLLWVWRTGATIGQLYGMVVQIAPLIISAALLMSGWLLVRAYRRAATTHLRRQIRLIAIASLSVGILWVGLAVFPRLVLHTQPLPGRWLMLAVGVVPLAYVAGGRLPDLYRLDRVIGRSIVHVLTALVLICTLGGLNTLIGLSETAALVWFAVAFVAFYRPVRQLCIYLLPQWLVTSPQHMIDDTIHTLTMTLDPAHLSASLMEGIRAQFGQPALALYLTDVDEPTILTLTEQTRINELPVRIEPGALTTTLRAGPIVIESWEVQQALHTADLSSSEQTLLAHPVPVLWCPLRQSQGPLIGLLLLGLRADLDPYRAEDIRGLERLLRAAALAFANSAAYTQQRAAEALIRQLYRHLQQAQDAAATAIARELHDEIINGHLRPDIEALQALVAEIDDPIVRSEVGSIIMSEQTVIGLLRMLCERLHPTGLDDPLGLAAVLRTAVLKTQAIWGGVCELRVMGTPQMIGAAVQQEALRVTREALSNAIQHAQAQQIVVELVYPVLPDQPVQLIIRDDGQASSSVRLRTGHWGLRFMQESARAVGGHVTWSTNPGQGTTVVFQFPLHALPRDTDALPVPAGMARDDLYEAKMIHDC